MEASLAQCLQLAAAGAQMIRLTTQGLKEVEALKEIKRRLRNAGCTVPLVADVHFTSDVAIAAAAVAEKVRINPGNFAKEHREAKEKFKKFLQVCKEHRTAVRIGLNHGSLGERITNLYGNTPLGMKEAAMEWVEMALAEDFHNFAVSLKASNTVVMVEAYRLLKREMESLVVSKVWIMSSLLKTSILISRRESAILSERMHLWVFLKFMQKIVKTFAIQ